MRIWVTGASGYSGSFFIKVLRESDPDCEIHALDISEDNRVGSKFFHKVNILDLPRLVALAKEYPPTHVMHFAACLFADDFTRLWDVNVQGTANLLFAFSGAGLSGVRTVVVGSAAEYAPSNGFAIKEDHLLRPSSDYGRSKVAQSALALALGKQLGQHITVARTFNLIGPGISEDLVPGAFLKRFMVNKRGNITICNPEAIRDFIDIRDAVRAYRVLLLRAQAGNVFNVCSGKGTSIRDLALQFAAAMNWRGQLQFVSDNEDPKASVVVGDRSKIDTLVGTEARLSIDESIADMIGCCAR